MVATNIQMPIAAHPTSSTTVKTSIRPPMKNRQITALITNQTSAERAADRPMTDRRSTRRRSTTSLFSMVSRHAASAAAGQRDAAREQDRDEQRHDDRTRHRSPRSAADGAGGTMVQHSAAPTARPISVARASRARVGVSAVTSQASSIPPFRTAAWAMISAALALAGKALHAQNGCDQQRKDQREPRARRYREPRAVIARSGACRSNTRRAAKLPARTRNDERLPSRTC